MEGQADPTTFRSYLTFWSGQLISLLGSSVAQFVIIWWITLETGSALYLSLASLLGFAPMIILSPFAGVFVDRWSRKALIGVVDFLQALVTVVLILLFSVGIVSIWYVLALLALRGVFQAFHNPAVAAIVPLMVPRDKLSRMNGATYLFSGAVTLAGPVLAAFLLEIWKIGQILWIDAVTFIIAVIPLLLVSIPSVRKEDPDNQDDPSFKREFSEGLAFVKKARGFLTFIMVATAMNFLLTPVSTLAPYFVKFDHFGGASDLAFVLASFQGGVLAGGLLMLVIKGFKRKMVAVVLSVYIIFSGYALMALAPTGLFWFMAMAGLVMAFCIPIANVSVQTITQTVVPRKILGRVSSVTGALASAASPLGMILSGVIVEFTRTANLFLACAVSGILILTLAWFFTDIRYVEEMKEGIAKNK
ncbi:MAG: MFS transporter [Candidatus Bathyarchaeota archaeon]|nr:MFS transporter [Candidatus Bathyarchaeota archaeon]MDH5779894.1 MFS transporter [Candidatus Bathyarchaeota archaeon]